MGKDTIFFERTEKEILEEKIEKLTKTLERIQKKFDDHIRNNHSKEVI